MLVLNRNLLTLLGCLLAVPLCGDDWPQWRGPNRNDVSGEKGLLREWPDGGPPQLWTNRNCGLGYSGFAVVGDRLYTMGLEDGEQFVLCLNGIDGSEVWRVSIGDNFVNNWGDGPRSTPTVDGDSVFALAADGTLTCLKADGGEVIWTTRLTDFGGKVPVWGYSESVLVDGDRVVCTPGADEGAVLALDRTSGKKIWQCSAAKDVAHYSSLVAATINGQKQYVQLLVSAVIGLHPENGELLWKADWPGQVAVIPSPIVHDNSVYVTSGYSVGSQRLRIDGGKAEVAWFNKVMKNHHGGVILLDQHLYGYSDGLGWICQDWQTGEEVWAMKDKLGKGAISYADGRLYCVSEEGGDVVLLEPSTEGWREHGRFTLAPQTERRKPQGRIWVHPVIAHGRLYLRDQEIVYCYDVKSPRP
jgi:outer membrane protein assembly factor BamB